MYLNNKLIIGKSENYEACILPKMANRHGLITGASGSGKTVTVKVLAESFSEAGVPVMLVDVKGDISGTCKPSDMNENVTSRVEKMGLTDVFKAEGFPVTFFDVFAKMGHPIRTTISSFDPRLLSKMLDLSDSQEGILAIAYQVANDENMKLNDLGDLKDILTHISDNKDKYISVYGNITTQSVASIQRKLLEFEQQDGSYFFGKPELQLYDLMQYDYTGHGFINILDAQELFKKPTLYAAFLIWLLNNLYDNMPEVGDLDKPKLVLFLDEAHLVFSEMSNNLIKQITQIVKLIRSKGVGVYFISQSPSDIPEDILSQLQNKVQHVLRSYTPADEKAIKAACNSFRANPNFKTDTAIKELGTGEALVSFLNEAGEPEIVQIVKILPPKSLMGPISDSDRDIIIKQSRIYGKYETIQNEVSASEIVQEEKEKKQQELEEIQKAKEEALKKKEEEKLAKQKEKEKKNSIQYKLGKKVVNSATNKVINKATTKAINSLFKGLFK